jgi:S-adenosylmethionine hydrolase
MAAIYLFTDFGAADVYVGQVKAVLQQRAPGYALIDLLHEAPAFNVKAGAHLLAALATRLPRDSVTMAVVDPGVGGTRKAVILQAAGSWFVGPDNGLLSVIAARAAASAVWEITWRPADLSISFHGRDLFAPIAAAIASSGLPVDKAAPVAGLDCRFGPGDADEIIYIDHYGNAATGVRAAALPRRAVIVVRGCEFAHAAVFSCVAAGDAFWYENSLGLVELAANGRSAAERFGLKVGDCIQVH